MATSVQIIAAPKQIVHKDSVFAYFCNAAGKIIPAPDTRMSAAQCGLGPEWRRYEAQGAREIERVSLIISRQMHNEKLSRTVAQHLREKAFIDQVRVRCKIRIAQAYSKNDESINRQILAKIEAKEADLFKAIIEGFDPTKRHTALDIELSEESTSPLANFGKKRQGIQ